jgi:cytochrome b561
MIMEESKKESEATEMKKNYIHFSAILIVMAVLLSGIAPVMAAERQNSSAETFVAILDPGTWSSRTAISISEHGRAFP